MILRVLVITTAGVCSFVLGSWLGHLIWPGSGIPGAVIGALIFGGGVLYLTRNVGR